MMTLVEVVACRSRLREANAILAQVPGAFIVAHDAAEGREAELACGARLANDALGLIADLLRMLEARERKPTRGE